VYFFSVVGRPWAEVAHGVLLECKIVTDQWKRTAEELLT